MILDAIPLMTFAQKQISNATRAKTEILKICYEKCHNLYFLDINVLKRIVGFLKRESS